MQFQNNKYRIEFGMMPNDNVVVKKAAFTIKISPKNKNHQFEESVLQSVQQSKEKVQLRLAYEGNINSEIRQINKGTPLNYNVYYTPQSKLITIEARINILSSKHENSRFNLIIQLGEKTSLLTDPIKCVSKLLVPKSAAEQLKESKQISVANESHSNKIKKTPIQSGTKPITFIRNNEKKLIQSVKKLNEDKKKDRNLIQLLYKQNLALVEHLNSISSVVNVLARYHNEHLQTSSYIQCEEMNYQTSNTNTHSDDVLNPMSSPALVPTSVCSQDEQEYQSQDDQNNSQYYPKVNTGNMTLSDCSEQLYSPCSSETDQTYTRSVIDDYSVQSTPLVYEQSSQSQAEEHHQDSTISYGKPCSLLSSSTSVFPNIELDFPNFLGTY